MDIKLIAIDIDGTLVNSKRELTNEVTEALQKAVEAGVKIVLCTGRPTPGAQDYIDQLGLNQVEDYSITYNGALVKRTDTGEIISQSSLNHDDFVEIYNAAEDVGVHFHMLHNDSVITLNKNINHYTVHESYVSNVPLYYRDFEDLDEDNLYSKMMLVDYPEILDEGIKYLPKTLWNKYTVLRSEGFYLEFLNKNSSKGTALKALAERLNISPDKVMALGDGGNDLDMVQYAGLGIAMGNAVDEVKEAADYVTNSSEEHGVATAIHKFVLDK